ncbi:MAG: hypothetical protein ACT4P2_05640 [Pseudomonadota bacterium]
MPNSSTASSDAEWLLARLPSELLAKLSDDLRAALVAAAQNRPWVDHPVDIRMSIPLPFNRFYLALVAGPERRPQQRRHVERQVRRLASIGNVLFVLTSVFLSYGVLVLAALLVSSILE